MEVNYVGEHILPGILGNSFIALAFGSALAGFLFFILGFKKSDNQFTRFGKAAFAIHGVSILGIILTLFYLLNSGYYEYDYVWKHSNSAMPFRYIFACFWEGQEGSFLLWMFWNVVLGSFFLRKNNEWQAPVLLVFSLVQIFLTSMVLGIYFGDFKVGSNPFVLIRELPENLGLPWTTLPNYLERIPQFQDGRGLNPLLQNYWMTIHPPTLFLGFSSTLVPFAFALAGIWKNKHQGWLRPVTPWAFFSLSVLGIGILMGGAWAYEALSFGGFWAWDPVENASLVPWLTLAGAAHLIVINRKKPTSIFATYVMSLITFILVLYSTFLTRSGVLGETSVHSFTDNGMTGQLLLYLLFFVALAVVSLLNNRYKSLIYVGVSIAGLIATTTTNQTPAGIFLFVVLTLVFTIQAFRLHYRSETEENLWSREFWLFTGSLVLALSALQITFSTSTPVWNLLIKPFSGGLLALHNSLGWDWLQTLSEAQFAPPSDAIQHYNKWQVPFAFIVCMLIAFGQFLSYKDTPVKKWLKNISYSAVAALAFTIILALQYDFEFNNIALLLLLFSSIWAIYANLDYFFRILKGKWKISGAPIAHIGFALILLGSLISAGKSEKISANVSSFDIGQLGEGFRNNEDVLLFKNDTVPMNKYFIQYEEKNKEGVNVYYTINYFEQNPNTYQQGDYVISKGMIFRATENHQPSENFVADQPYWQEVENPTSEELQKVKVWSPFRPGEKLFSLNPRIQLNPTFGNVPEPDTKHYFGKDIYTHIKWAQLEELEADADGYLEPAEYTVSKGDTMFAGKYLIVFKNLSAVRDFEKYRILETDVAAKAELEIIPEFGQHYFAEPLFILRDSSLVVPDVVEVPELMVKVQLSDIIPEERKVKFLVAEHKSDKKEFIVMQAILFPGINILWIGCILMFVGTILAVLHRVRENKRLNANGK